jgi:uncharacterized protein (TIGR03663 family)
MMSSNVRPHAPSLNKDKIIYWSILFLAFLSRFAALSIKPPHSDEGVNGFFVNQLWERGYFIYSSQNYHGPLLFSLFQISEKLFGFGIHSLRAVTALFSLFTVWIILRTAVLGRYASFFAAMALALSPGMIFFGRSAIHEPVFVFFQVLWMVGFMKLKERIDRQAILMFSAGLMGCVLLKETFVIFGCSLLAAWAWIEISPGLLGALGRRVDSPPRVGSEGVDGRFLLKTGIILICLWVVFFAGFFHNRKGMTDFFVALIPWLKTGVGGSGHDKPFSYWLDLMGRYEWAALAGIVGAAAGVFSHSWKMRAVSFFALVNSLVYSLIPYKTPWCIMDILWPFVLVSGYWFERAVIALHRKSVPAFLLILCVAAIIVGHSAVVGYRLNYVNYTGPHEPYVYVQTKNDVTMIQELIRTKTRERPDFQNLKVQVNVKDPWPLPWLFSRLPRAEFGNQNLPPVPGADIIFTEVSVSDRDLAGSYVRRKIELRDAREPIYVYLKKSVFEGMDLPGFTSVEISEGKEF